MSAAPRSRRRAPVADRRARVFLRNADPVLGRLGDEALSRMSDEEVEAALTEVPGIGPWSARGFLLVALDRPDVFLAGDIALRRVIQRVYEFDHVPTEAELSELSDRWRPYRSLAVSYLFASE